MPSFVLGPASLNFGEVCMRASSEKRIDIINNLDQFVHVVIEVSWLVFYDMFS